MKVGIFAVLFAQRPFEEVLDHIKEAGCEAVEIGCGGYPGDAHCRPKDLLADKQARQRLKDAVARPGIEISALSCHGNPLPPDRGIAGAHDAVFRDTVRLAAALGVATVVTFSGCPGDSDTAKAPNWVTCPWPPDFADLLEWQWREKVTPYWTEAAKFPRDNSVPLAIELHPAFVAYHTPSFCPLPDVGR